MYSSRNSLLLLAVTVSMILLWCTVQPSKADANEEGHHLVDSSEDDDDGIDDFDDLYRRASLRPFNLQQRASLRPYAGKRASLRPYTGKRASLRPYAGKRASLRPAHYMGKRKRRNVLLYDE